MRGATDEPGVAMALEISSTPLQLNIRYAEYPDVIYDRAPATPAALVSHAVVGPGRQLTDFGQGVSNLAGAFLAQEEANNAALRTQLQASGIDVADPLRPLGKLDTLPDLFTTQWKAAHDQVVDAVEDAILSSGSALTAKDFTVNVPPAGTLSAAATRLERADFPELFPLQGRWLAGSEQLTLTYAVPGFSGSFTNDTGDFSPTWNFTFDGAVVVKIAIATDPRERSHLSAAFLTSNTNATPGNVAAGLLETLGLLIDAVVAVATVGQVPELIDVNNSLPDQSSPLSGILKSFEDSLSSLWTLFAAAYELGFTELSPAVTATALPDATPGHTAELLLTHPRTVPPVVTLTTAPALFVTPAIVVAPPGVLVNGEFTVSGRAFPPARATQLTVTWSDPTPFVRQSYIAWGTVDDDGRPPSNPDVESRMRSGSYDGGNEFTTTTPLQPSTTYAFLVQDVDLPTAFAPSVPRVSTEQSAWAFIETAYTDQIDLVLDYDKTHLAFTTLQPDGTFRAPVTMPATVPPGTYTITAYLGLFEMAQASITVTDSVRDLRPTLHVLTPATGVPIAGIALVAGGIEVMLQGYNFPLGPVRLSVDTGTGASLGTATAANPAGSFTQSVIWPIRSTGPHTILAESAGGVNTLLKEATATVYGEPLAQ
jgi:hypothetical protein